MIKRLLLIICPSGASVHAAANGSEVLLAPIDAARIGSFDWGVVVLPDPIPDKGSSADRGSLKVNLDLAKFFSEGFAIYSITKLENTNQAAPGLLLVLVRPKKQ